LKSSLRYDWAFRGLVLAMLVVACCLFRDFGITWDEPNQNQYGKYVLQYYETFFADKSSLTFLDAYLYGALFDSVAAFLVRLSPFEEYQTRHLLNALVGIVGVIGAWKLAHLLAGYRAAFLAALLLFLEPSYFGHMFNNPKDIPFAAGYVWSLYYLLKSLAYLPNIPTGLMLKLGAAIGLTLGVRIGGLVVLGYLGLAVVAYCAFPDWFAKKMSAVVRPLHGYKALGKSVLGILVVTYAVMLVFWPWAQQNPLIRPFEALEYMTQFHIQDSGLLARVLIGGEYLFAKDLPASYMPHYFAVKMPEFILAGLGLGVVLAIWFLVGGKAKEQKLQTSRYALLIFAVLFPLIYVIVKKSVFYDTMRHFLFIVPCLCVISGIALAKLLDLLGRGEAWRKIVALACLVVILLPQIYAIVRLHPHQYVYYNSLAGGVEGANGRYEMDYWGNSYKEAVELLVGYLKQNEGSEFSKREYRIWVVGPEVSASYYFPTNFKLTKDARLADFAISFTRWGLDKKVPGTPIVAVERMGVELAVVKEVRKH
jgi:hypothetical protein